MRQYAGDIAFTPAVKAIQSRKGSRSAYSKVEKGRGWQTFALRAYARFVEEGIRTDRASELDELDRAAELGGILGSSEFIAGFSRRLDRSRRNREHSKRERFVDRPPLERILKEGDVDGLAGRIESARRDHGYSLEEIRRALGIDRRTVVRLVRACKVNRGIVVMSHMKT